MRMLPTRNPEDPIEGALEANRYAGTPEEQIIVMDVGSEVVRLYFSYREAVTEVSKLKKLDSGTLDDAWEAIQWSAGVIDANVDFAQFVSEYMQYFEQ